MVTLPFTAEAQEPPVARQHDAERAPGRAALPRRSSASTAFVVAATVGVFAYEPILHFLLRPLCTVDASTKHHTSSGSFLIVASNGTCNLFVTSPLDGLSLRIKIAVFGGLVLASPVILFQVWRFVTPG